MTTLNGRPLHEFEIEQIIEIASAPGHRRYVGGDKDDFWRNQDLLRAFAGTTERTSIELAAVFHAQHPEWSEHFNALRAGETLQWSLEHGIVERIGARPTPRWHLLHRELQFELLGPEKKQHAIRVRGLTGDAAVIAARLWEREQKRRERARLRAIEKFKPVVLQQIAAICRRNPDRRIDDIRELAPFVVGDINTFAACRQLIEDSLDDLGGVQIYWLCECLKSVVRELPKAPPPPAADLAILGDLQL
jgi:hypothetical protein